ncbi:MAG: NADP-specific glutamate dehydrogenase [Lawsonibacter sp.]|nr:NADP-specific glutamate dehydrogenase [Lawsonibacter sp.]
MNNYAARVLERLRQKYPSEPEYLQSVQTWLEMIDPALDDPRYEKLDLLTRMVEPERMVTFLVPWVDDKGNAHTCHGYRVQFNSAIGPYKGGLRFHPSVNESVVKFLGFEQTYKNALTGLPIGGASGGADFDPRGKSDREIMRFCQSFMNSLYRYIGADTDIPAGDIGVGAREIGYLYGQYKRLLGKAESSALTGKGLTYGGSKVRLEAAGSGTVYFLERMVASQNDTLEGRTIAVSGFGNMSWGVCRKAAQLGAKVVTLAGPDGSIYDPEGVNTQEKLDFLLKMRDSGKDKVSAYAREFGVEFFPGKKPWEVKTDVVIPCATQNELDVEDAICILANDVRYYVEGANMPATSEAMRLLRLSPKILAAGAKASGSGGVAVSALEMAQNSIRYNWKRSEVDEKLRQIMGSIYDASAAAAQEYGLGDDLIAGNDIAAFKKISEAMIAQGL